MSTPDDAIKEFNTSSKFPVPVGYEPWAIRNDYPAVSIERPAEWYDIDFTKDPMAFLEAAKKYILEGNVENNFIVQKNKIRNWYHAPWRHYGNSGREPVNGLFWGPPTRISKDVPRKAQIWGNSFFNGPAATVLRGIWNDPSNPQFNNHLIFPARSFMFLLNLTNVTGEEFPILKHVPEFEACIAKSPEDDPSVRDEYPTPIRLYQIEFRARTGLQNDIGWVFGNFILDGREQHTEWNLVPCGLQWGNDPTVTQTGQDLKETWYNEKAVELMKEYYSHESAPIKGWQGRLAGITDSFMTACASCHSAAQYTPEYPFRTPTPFVQSPQPVQLGGEWIQQYDGVQKIWFRNNGPGTSFDKDSLSSDYSHGVHLGYEEYLAWRAKE